MVVFFQAMINDRLFEDESKGNRKVICAYGFLI